ncbi:MAG TPA: sigma-70 family RNA polymerase sigma factor [Gemmatimonadaceae bacterium]|jgi:RNA polymerase sigma factor (sigma-70 family)|nr:sigma-70 family RNA polymerase sigma factor [Gemmatimonadaceae bacterium]
MHRARFDAAVLPYLDDGYTLARYLTRDDEAARDVVQEACLRALRHVEGLRGDDGRSWFLAIVRSRCVEWFREQGRGSVFVEYDETVHVPEAGDEANGTDDYRGATSERVLAAVDALPAVFREVIVLRELCGLSYRAIAEVTGVPAGTVMSRLARARDRLRVILTTREEP